jgi:hypothetical protein
VDLREIGWGEGGGVDSPGSGWGSLAGSCEYGDEPSGSGATELVICVCGFALSSPRGPHLVLPASFPTYS